MKVLIGTPIHEDKLYSWEEYVTHIKNIKIKMQGIVANVLIVDTTPDTEKSSASEVEFLANKENFMFKSISTKKKMDKVVAGRNLIFEVAKKGDYDAVLFIDSDVLVPSDVLDNLMQSRSNIVGGFYPITTELGFPIPSAKMLNLNAGGYVPFPDENVDDKTHSVDLIGMGCCLIKKDIFNQFEFRCERGAFSKLLKSEDMCFCEDLKKVGVDIKFNTAVVCKHKINGDHWDKELA